MSADGSREELARRVDAIEAGYEMMLAYAAQGLPTDQGAASGAQLRAFLERFDHALTGLADEYHAFAMAQGLGPHDAIDNFLQILSRDAATAQAGIRLVLGQASISSQLVDNLNASIHVRALLTDIFLIDELCRPQG
ncbi:MAG: hypothetical protein ACRD2N_12525 [Vicinamibacterales bacterium]